ncbi:chaperonin 10-like protein [Butyriboletus roseoflavus]|nr:chaperonin 10-like protein [Butyriboletus roseoflavus]
MASQKALWLNKPGTDLVLAGNEIPEPGPGEILVKNYAVSLNPMDWYFPKAGFFLMKNFPVVIGEEGAGIVEKVGQDVANLAVGDKVFYATKFNFQSKYAAFQEYTLISADLAGKMPDNITFDQAASICIGILPFVVPTYSPEPHGFGFTAPFEDEGGVGKYAGQPILIMAGSCSLGQYAIQLARLSGFSPIITTASLHNTEYLQSLGATHVLDRRLSKEALNERIAQLHGGTPLLYAFDAVSLEDTQRVAYDSLAPGGKFTEVFLEILPRHDPAGGKRVLHAWGSFEVTTPGVREFGQRFMRELSGWIAEGKIKPNVVEVLPGGLNGVKAGLERLERGEVSARKLIVHPQETEF